MGLPIVTALFALGVGLSLVTLGVSDLARSRAFYEALGWKTGAAPADDVVFFQAGGMIVALWGRDQLAADSGVEDTGGWGGITLAHNVRSPAEVDAVLGDLRQLPEADLHRALQSQRDYITEWSELLRAVRPDLDAVAAGIQVQAALMVVGDGAHTPHLARRPGFAPAILAVASRLLGPAEPHLP